MLLRTDRAARACYRTDGGQIVYGFPDSVVHARSPGDVASVLRIAQRDRIPVTCRGGGLTTEGESVAARGILLDLKGMNRLLDCDGDTAWVEAGMTWHQVAEALRPRGLDYTSAPLNMLSTVGGTLGVGGIDVNSPRHGCSADQAVELEVVTPTGDIVRVKEGDEYLERVLLGYGQFGVITKARIKVRRYRPMTVRHFLYTDVGVALADMMRLVERDEVDAGAILTLRDDVIALILGFEDEPKDFPLRNTPEPLIVAKMAAALRAAPVAVGRGRLPDAAQGGPPAGAAGSAVRARRPRSRPNRGLQPPDLALLGRAADRHPGSRDHEIELRGRGPARHRRLQEVLPLLHAVCRHDPQVRKPSALRDERDPGDRRRPRLRDRVFAAARGRELLARSLPAVQERDLRYRPRSRRQLLPLRRRHEAVRPPHVRRRDGEPTPRDEAGARPGVHPQP